jgi:hypothetical protein
MTGVLVGLLAVLWAVVLLPVLLKAKDNSSISLTVGTFNRSMRALSSNHEVPNVGGRWVLTPRNPMEDTVSKQTEIIFLRRRIFCGMLAALAFCLPASLVPGLRFLIWVSAALFLGLVGFAAFLINEKNKKPYRPAVPQERFRAVDDIPSVLRIEPTPPVRVLHNGTRPVYLIEDEVLADDDGLSELGWAQAARY